jgi:hypothetical protein
MAAPARLGRAALLVGAVGYSVLLARTTPFTGTADVATAVPLALFLVALVLRRPARPAIPLVPVATRRWPWVVVAVATVGWELYCYLAPGSRSEHPTFSSMTDAVDRTWGLKVVVVLAWLLLGWAILALPRSKTEADPK